MIEALKKRCKVGDIVTIQTIDNSFTGRIEEFEDTCIILDTIENTEFIANSSIVRFSAPKNIDNVNKITEVSIISEEKINNRNTIETKEITEIENSGNETIKPNYEYKVGDIIPLELLTKLTDKKQKVPKSQFKPKTTFKSFEDLEQLISSEIEEENKKTVSANGVIVKCFGAKGYGFITDKYGYEIYFNLGKVLDKELYNILCGTDGKINIPVIFTLSKNYKGDSALFIHKPKTIEEIASLAKTNLQNDKIDIALGLINQILFSFPEARIAIKLKDQIQAKQFKVYTSKNLFKSFDLNYQKATKAKNIDKNFEEALKYYLIALKNNEKKESCIKDIAMLYVSMGEIKKAMEFMSKHEDNLQDNITTYNYLANFYSSVKDFEKVIEQIDSILEEKYITMDKKKYSMYLSQKGFALIQLKDFESAREVLDEAIGYYNDNSQASWLLKALDEPNQEEFDKLVMEAFEELGFLGSQISIYLKEQINSCEFDGLKSSSKSKILETGELKKYYLEEIRETLKLKEITAGKSEERARYLLTEASLMFELEPQKQNELRSVLAKYCNAMASSAISEMFEGSLDVARFYYIEAFNLEEDWGSLRTQVALFLSSLKSTNRQLITKSSPSFDDTLSLLFNDNSYNSIIWNNVLSAFVSNKVITAQLIKRIFDVDNYRNISIEFLQSCDINLPSQNFSLNEYADAWNKAREKRNKEYKNWIAAIKSISRNENLDILTNQLSDSLNESRRSWLSQLDCSRLTVILTDILDVLNQYLRQSGYRDKERFFGFAKAQVNQLVSEIKEKPTKFSYEGFVPLLEKIDILLDKSFKTVDSASTPVVKVSILGEASIVAIDKTVPLKLLVENSKESSPIRDIIITIKENKDITPCSKVDYFDTVDGGESCELHANVKVSENVIKDRATTIDVVCSYKKRNQDEPVLLNDQLSLRLYSEEEFELIPNPYEKLANGGPVTDTSMFYGRNEFIERITYAIIQADSKQVVIYGQKRSGKSSVLHHLKKSLENTNQTFCISFSIGDIYENISSATFFFKILSLIEEEIENISFNGQVVPDFKCPQYVEFKDNPNPADLFRKYIRNFKRGCSILDNWKNKKLVVMIDEFTYLYTAIKTDKVSDAIMKQWKAITQNEDSMFSSVLVGQDVFPMFKDDFPNEFGITQDERLTYLSKSDALRLIEEPIGKTKTNRNRFIGNTLDTIIDYTSCNPYYIQIFCARLVSEMNRKKYIEVTNADVKEIADSFIIGGQALTDDKFDNLLNAGEKYDIQKISKDESKAILRKIATNAMNIGFCLREQISFGNLQREDEILKDLVKREVLEQKGDSYKIQVKLFQEWLLKH